MSKVGAGGPTAPGLSQKAKPSLISPFRAEGISPLSRPAAGTYLLCSF